MTVPACGAGLLLLSRACSTLPLGAVPLPAPPRPSGAWALPVLGRLHPCPPTPLVGVPGAEARAANLVGTAAHGPQGHTRGQESGCPMWRFSLELWTLQGVLVPGGPGNTRCLPVDLKAPGPQTSLPRSAGLAWLWSGEEAPSGGAMRQTWKAAETCVCDTLAFYPGPTFVIFQCEQYAQSWEQTRGPWVSGSSHVESICAASVTRCECSLETLGISMTPSSLAGPRGQHLPW